MSRRERCGQFLQEGTLYQARFDQSALNLSPSEPGTSTYAGSSAGTSSQDEEGRSRVSTYSYRTDRDSAMFRREVDGRDKQHTAVVIGLGGLYPAKEEVQAILAQQKGETKRILDLGCGTGIWAIQMSLEYPHASILGVDLAPVPVDGGALPPNCRFEIDDINLGLSQFHGQFDVVHIRFVGSGLKNFEDRMRDVHACLKPGGIVLWIDADFDVYSTERFGYRPPAADDHSGSSWPQRVTSEVRRASLKLGSDISAMEAALDAGLWKDPSIDSTTCRTGSLYLPIGQWASHEDPVVSQLFKYVGALMRQDFIGGAKSIVPLMTKVGWRREVVETWERNLIQELTELKTHPVFRVRLAWGRRKPVPARSVTQQIHSMVGMHESFPMIPYPWFYLYDSEEAALKQAEERRERKGR
ncbi:hypothetical protein FRC17_001235 [Serendipita sp. 399]|nr:hypothetical protein FRC17_001235 [Serendipita sp. 399]